MNVLSLFDGMSCGRIALERAGIKVDKYFASEIDKHAIKVSQHNYPDIVQLGDVTNWKKWDLPKIDLIIGGSPCQGFSFSGKQLAFDDPRSALFFEFLEIYRTIRCFNPQVKFMLENVRMKKQSLDVITDLLGVEPIFINSNLLVAQSRPRYYWSNWDFKEPEPTNKKVISILEDDVDKKYFISDSYKKRLIESTDLIKGFSAINPEQALCMTARQYANWKGTLVVPDAIRGRYNKSKKVVQVLEPRSDGITNSLTTVTKDNVIAEYQLGDLNIRKLTPVECERLQTVPDNYTSPVSDAQRYKMLGNGWTVDVVAHILKGLTND